MNQHRNRGSKSAADNNRPVRRKWATRHFVDPHWRWPSPQSLYPAQRRLRARPNRQDADTIEEVIVTATRRSENLQEVPQSVTALTTDFIEKQALTNLSDLAGALPSLNIVSTWPGQNSIIIRGITTGSSQYRIDSQVSVYLDEQPMTSITQQADVRLIDIERVELLPGPQGTLFGSSAQAGTLHYVTNKPDVSGFSSQIDLEGGTTKGGSQSYDVSGWVNIPVSDNFALRAVGFWSKEGGCVDNVLGPTLMGEATNAESPARTRTGIARAVAASRDFGRSIRNGSCSPRASTSESKTDGHAGTPTPSSARTRSRASSTIGAMTSGTRCRRR